MSSAEQPNDLIVVIFKQLQSLLKDFQGLMKLEQKTLIIAVEVFAGYLLCITYDQEKDHDKDSSFQINR